MRIVVTVNLLLTLINSARGFVVVNHQRRTFTASRARVSAPLYGYLDDLSSELYKEADNPDIEGSTKEVTDLDKKKVDRFSVGDWSSYVEFDEFDGGDGQMGCAGDGNKGLEKFGDDVSPSIANMGKSRSMSSKNSWGSSSGYADRLRDEGVETSRAQQLENWSNQQEISKRRAAQQSMTEQVEEGNSEEDWRALSKFGIERNQEFDMDETFGDVTVGAIDGVFELNALLNQNALHEFELKNEYMGFADFRASFTPETGNDWSISPTEGSLTSREATKFTLRFRANNPQVVTGHLVVETEDFKKTYQLIGKGG